MLQVLHVSGFSEFPEASIFEKDLLWSRPPPKSLSALLLGFNNPGELLPLRPATVFDNGKKKKEYKLGLQGMSNY